MGSHQHDDTGSNGQAHRDTIGQTWMLSDLARLYAIKKEPDVLKTYQAKEGELKNIERKLGQLKDTGATGRCLDIGDNALIQKHTKMVNLALGAFHFKFVDFAEE